MDKSSTLGRTTAVRPEAIASRLVARLRRRIGWAGTAAARLAARPTLFQRFMLVSLVILVVGAYVIGSYVAGEIKARVIQRTPP